MIVDRIYRGSLLNLFYLEREMLSWDEEGDGVRIRFAGGVEAQVCIAGAGPSPRDLGRRGGRRRR